MITSVHDSLFCAGFSARRLETEVSHMKRFVTIFLTLALLAGLLAIPAGAANTALDTAAKKGGGVRSLRAAPSGRGRRLGGN